MKHNPVWISVLVRAENSPDYVLTIDHPDRGVSLPEGFVRAGESASFAAIRETLAQTGYLVRPDGSNVQGIVGVEGLLVAVLACTLSGRYGDGEPGLRPLWRPAEALASPSTAVRLALEVLR